MRGKLLSLILVVLLVLLGMNYVPEVKHSVDEALYPREYSRYVEQYAAEYNLDPLLVYSFIRTESSFDPQARSNVDARGLMQITEITFEWLKPRVGADESITFEDLYDPETNIRFGCYYVSRCMERYHQDVATAAASYHSGWGTVDNLLANSAYSADGLTLSVFPYPQMNNYVAKITRAYTQYQSIYSTEGELK